MTNVFDGSPVAVQSGRSRTAPAQLDPCTACGGAFIPGIDGPICMCCGRAAVRLEPLPLVHGHSSREPQRGHANAEKQFCPEGHPYDDANTYFAATGWRSCRACNRQRQAAYAASHPRKPLKEAMAGTR